MAPLYIGLTIPYILKEKHCNKCIHTIINTWQPHNDLIIIMLTRSHYIHKCVHTIKKNASSGGDHEVLCVFLI